MQSAIEVYLGQPDGIDWHVAKVAVLPLPQPNLDRKTLSFEYREPAPRFFPLGYGIYPTGSTAIKPVGSDEGTNMVISV